MREKTQQISGLVYERPQKSQSYRLSWRLTTLFLLWIALLTASISYTFVLNKRISDYYVSLSLVSSIRSDIYKANIMTDDRFTRVEFKELTDTVGASIRNLRVLIEASNSPSKEEALEYERNIRLQWHTVLSKMLTDARALSQPINVPTIEGLMPDLRSLEYLLLRERNVYATVVHAVQVILVALCIFGFFIILYFIVKWVIHPIDVVSDTIEKITRGNLSTRMDLHGSAEFEHISEGFNRMAARLQSLVHGLETITQEKTAAVEERNRNLAQLYEITSSLARTKSVVEMCDSFTLRLIHYTGASASAVFLLDEKTQRLELAAHTDLPQKAIDALRRQELFYTDAEEFSFIPMQKNFHCVKWDCGFIRTAIKNCSLISFLFPLRNLRVPIAFM